MGKGAEVGMWTVCGRTERKWILWIHRIQMDPSRAVSTCWRIVSNKPEGLRRVMLSGKLKSRGRNFKHFYGHDRELGSWSWKVTGAPTQGCCSGSRDGQCLVLSGQRTALGWVSRVVRNDGSASMNPGGCY